MFCVLSGPVVVACPGCGWGVAYSSCGRAPIAGCVFCVWSSPVARCVASPSCGVYFAYGRGLLCGAYSGCGWGLAAWRVFCARLRVFLFVMRWIIPLCLILTAFFPPSPERAETSYLRVQCLCGRADVWRVRAVGATILDVFG